MPLIVVLFALIFPAVICAQDKFIALPNPDGLYYFYDVSTGERYWGPFNAARDYGCNGLAPVSLSGENDWHFIDKSGDRAVPGPFRDAHQFSGDMAGVLLQTGEWHYINSSGDILGGPFDFASPFYGSCALVKLPGEDKYTIVDRNFNVMLHGVEDDLSFNGSSVGDNSVWSIRLNRLWFFWHPRLGFLSSGLDVPFMGPSRFGIAAISREDGLVYRHKVLGEVFGDQSVVTGFMGSWFGRKNKDGFEEVYFVTGAKPFGDFESIFAASGRWFSFRCIDSVWGVGFIYDAIEGLCLTSSPSLEFRAFGMMANDTTAVIAGIAHNAFALVDHRLNLLVDTSERIPAVNIGALFNGVEGVLPKALPPNQRQTLINAIEVRRNILKKLLQGVSRERDVYAYNLLYADVLAPLLESVELGPHIFDKEFWGSVLGPFLEDADGGDGDRKSFPEDP
ncbi:MAG: hypothetical protein EA402_14230 [Planctomycetota bacterium]|nr:MAG: hypothetical protein EA402_14230 [Planctomycetota bacterium]